MYCEPFSGGVQDKGQCGQEDDFIKICAEILEFRGCVEKSYDFFGDKCGEEQKLCGVEKAGGQEWLIESEQQDKRGGDGGCDDDVCDDDVFFEQVVFVC